VPIYRSATFAHKGFGDGGVDSTGYDYTRVSNPTRDALEKLITQLEGGTDALAYSSGMAAIASVMELFKPGDHIIGTDDLYGGTTRLFDDVNSKNGMEFSYVDTGDLDAIKKAIKPNTRAIFIETPSNPTLLLTDIAAIKKLIGEDDILLIVDNTFLTPIFQQPIKLGADIVIHSGTKYLAGHNDVVAGFAITNNPDISERLSRLYKTIGCVLSPDDSYSVIRGIKTLELRMERAQANAIKIVKFLRNSDIVKKLYYPSLDKSVKSLDIMRRQSTGYGAMLSFDVGDEATAQIVLENLEVIKFAESLGGVETLITYPKTQTHGELSDIDRQRKGITDGFLRLSVGIESPNDLIRDLEKAFAAVKQRGIQRKERNL
jgi:cystathionine gamma-synthase